MFTQVNKGVGNLDFRSRFAGQICWGGGASDLTGVSACLGSIINHDNIVIVLALFV